MPTNLPVSLILLVVSLILSALMMPSFSNLVLIAVGINAVILLVTRFVARVEDNSSTISIWTMLASFFITAVITELNFARLIVFAVYVVTTVAMRHIAKTEAYEAKALAKRHP